MWFAKPKPMIVPNYKKDPGNLFLDRSITVVYRNSLLKIKLQAKKRLSETFKLVKQFVSWPQWTW